MTLWWPLMLSVPPHVLSLILSPSPSPLNPPVPISSLSLYNYIFHSPFLARHSTFMAIQIVVCLLKALKIHLVGGGSLKYSG